ncbi:MAG: iron-sulfur cluster repair di-iron protein [Abditibacteriaceae bacterium]
MSNATIADKNSQNDVFENVTVGQLVTENPGRARVLESVGLDYCCGGKHLLSEACAEKGLNYATVATELAAYDATHSAEGTDWASASMADLADNIIEKHHGYLSEELPRLEYLAGRVKNAHGDKHPSLIELNDIVCALSSAQLKHNSEEENELFPKIKKLESATSAADLDFDSLSDFIGDLEAQHAKAGAALEKIKELTHNYTPPSDTCNTHRVFLVALQELENDMHIHIHKENSILFPRALAKETQLRN